MNVSIRLEGTSCGGTSAGRKRALSASTWTLQRLLCCTAIAPWNLLFEGEKLTGIIDFEATHLNYRVADFANSWRGYQEEVIDGYQEIHELSELDWQLLTPVYWSWIFLDVKDEIQAMVSGKVPPHDLEWPIRHLMRREGLLGQRADPYPGAESRFQTN